jgi:hypothetical protein
MLLTTAFLLPTTGKTVIRCPMKLREPIQRVSTIRKIVSKRRMPLGSDQYSQCGFCVSHENLLPKFIRIQPPPKISLCVNGVKMLGKKISTIVLNSG